MKELLEIYPGAQRALFRNYHIGGCASCGFSPDETLAGVCARNDNLDVSEVLEKIRAGHEEDQQFMIEPLDASERLSAGAARFVDIRTAEEFEAVQIAGSRHFSQPLLQEIMGGWPKDGLIVVVDHTGVRGLDAAAYFSGHGFTNVKVLRGGIDAWSEEVDSSLPRYTIE